MSPLFAFQWEIWLVPLIAMAVWILGALMRGGKQEKRPAAPEPGRGNGGEGGRAPQPNTDLERFLEEVQRRRQAAEPAEPREQQAAEGRARSEPSGGRPYSSPSRRPRPARPPRPRPQVEDALPLEVDPVVRSEPLMVLPVAAPPIGVSLAVEAATSRPPRPAQERAQLRGPLTAMLKSSESLRTAIALREIFDPPLCKRRRG